MHNVILHHHSVLHDSSCRTDNLSKRVLNMASLLEGVSTSVGVPVEFVQGGCDQAEGYVSSQKATAIASVAYSPVTGVAKATPNNSVPLHHSVMVQSTTQQPAVVVGKYRKSDSSLALATCSARTTVHFPNPLPQRSLPLSD